jgi:hypothetical protein
MSDPSAGRSVRVSSARLAQGVCRDVLKMPIGGLLGAHPVLLYA